MSDNRKFKIGGVEKSLKELWKEKKDAVASLVTNDGKWNDLVATLQTASDDDYKNYKFKINKKGEMEPILNETSDVTADDIVFSSSKSNLRRIADLERNVSILANRIATVDGNVIDTSSLDAEDDRDWGNYITEDTFFTKDVNLGNYSDDKIKVYGHLYINNGITFGTNAQDVIRDLVGGMVSSNSESGISVSYDTVNHNLDFNVSDPTITLTGDVSGSATMTNLGNVSITATVANDSHTHSFANITGKPTTLAGYGITDSLASGSHTHAFSDLTGTPTTLAGYGITDAAPDTAFVGVTVNNDTLTFTRDNGTTIAVTTSDANTNYYVTGGSFDPATQVLTLTRNSGSATVDLSGLVTSAELTSAISGLVNGADAAYDTLLEIQNAMATDAELSAAISGLTIGNGTMTIAPGAAMTGGGSFTANQTGNSTITISHADTSSQASVNNSGRTYIQDVTLDAYGHVTGLVSATETVTDTHYTSLNVIGATGTTTNAATTNGNTYLKHVENGALTSSHKIVGSGATTVTTDASGNITISSTDTNTNTTYTGSKGITLSGTDFRLTGNEIPGSVDLNTYRTTGYYAQNANADASSGTNYPTANAGILQVINDDYGNGLHTTQLYSQYNSTNYYIRTYYNGTWTAWRNLSQDIDTNVYVTGASFNTTDGVLTLTRNSGSVTVDLDGRFTDNAYADTMNQHVRTTDSPTFAAVTAVNFNGTATYAKYADLAERYAADAPYEEGTLLAFGGEAEVTAAQGYASTKIAGVVSVKPAVAMNAEAGNSQTHPFVALQGRVPVKVVGTVRKGDILVASDIAGVATVWKSEDTDPRMTAYVGIAIENKIEGGVGFVEVKVGK